MSLVISFRLPLADGGVQGCVGYAIRSTTCYCHAYLEPLLTEGVRSNFFHNSAELLGNDLENSFAQVCLPRGFFLSLPRRHERLVVEVRRDAGVTGMYISC